MAVNKFEKAKIALEYRPELKEAFDFVKNYPTRFHVRFLELLENNPKINKEQIVGSIMSEYTEWSSPYEDDELNKALSQVRNFGDDAENEFTNIIKVLDGVVDVAEVVEELKKKYFSHNEDVHNRDRLKSQKDNSFPNEQEKHNSHMSIRESDDKNMFNKDRTNVIDDELDTEYYVEYYKMSVQQLIEKFSIICKEGEYYYNNKKFSELKDAFKEANIEESSKVTHKSTSKKNNDEQEFSFKWLLFSLDGRISRGTYWITLISLVAINYILLFCYSYSVDAYNDFFATLFIVLGCLTIWPHWAISAKRWHDRGTH